jgi:uridine phosphorylase
MTLPYPILEFDCCREAIMEPSLVRCGIDMPEKAVVCFFHDVVDRLVEAGEAKVLFHARSEMGRHPVYEIEKAGQRMALFQPGIGAPFAAAFLEEVIAHGCRKFVVCGGCGVLDGGIPLGHVLVPVSAVRDEGTSYHYLPPGREVAPTPSALAVIESTLRDLRVNYLTTKTWTTDAVYRETRDRVNRRIAEGCMTVEMEAAALFAVAQFRGVELGQLLFAGDDLSGEAWDSRDWNNHTSGREKLFSLAREVCARL